MSTTYPTLASMGVQHPTQITSYTLSQIAPDTDVLKIKYQRPKGSFLPITRSYTIGRSKQTQVVDSGSGQVELMYEISPVLSQAIHELDSIVQSKSSQAELKQQILSELKRVENEFAAEMRSLKQLIEKLDTSKP